MEQSDDAHENDNREEGGSGHRHVELENLQKLRDAARFLREVEYTFRDQEGKYESFFQAMKDINDKRIDPHVSIARVKEMLKAYPSLIHGFHNFLSEDYEIDEQVLHRPRRRLEDANKFLAKVKERCPNAYKPIVDILRSFNKRSKDVVDVAREVSVLLYGHLDLQFEFGRFLPDAAEITAAIIISSWGDRLLGSSVHMEQSNQEFGNDEASSVLRIPVNKKRHEEVESCVGYMVFIKCLGIFGRGIISWSELQEIVANLIIGFPDLVPRYRAFLEEFGEVISTLLLGVADHRKEHEGFEEKKQCKHKKYDRFELDILLESLISASESAEKLLNRITTDGTDGPIRLEDHFTVHNLRCIELLYGEQTAEVMDLLRKTPRRALPVVLKRLKQKQEELIVLKDKPTDAEALD